MVKGGLSDNVTFEQRPKGICVYVYESSHRCMHKCIYLHMYILAYLHIFIIGYA